MASRSISDPTRGAPHTRARDDGAEAPRPFAECHTEHASSRRDIWLFYDEGARVYRVSIRHHDGFEASRDEAPLCRDDTVPSPSPRASRATATPPLQTPSLEWGLRRGEEAPEGRLPTVAQYLAAPTEDKDVQFIQAAISLHADVRVLKSPAKS